MCQFYTMYTVCVYTQGLAFAWCSFFGIITPFSLTIGGLKPYVRYIYFSHNIFSHGDDCVSVYASSQGLWLPHMFPTHYLLMFPFLKSDTRNAICVNKTSADNNNNRIIIGIKIRIPTTSHTAISYSL